MANQRDLDLLLDVREWNYWRQETPDIYPSLSGADLCYSHLSGADLSGIDLSSADLSYADLREANLNEANLSGADFNNARVGWTSFGNVDLQSAKGLETVRHIGPSTIGVDTIYRSGGNIPEVFLRGAGVDDTFIAYMRSLVNNPIEYYTCFISYSSKDQEFAQRLHNDLQANGVRCWYAAENMNIGDKIRLRIDESIRLYDKLLVILSENSIASDWVAYEVERALNKEPKGVPNVLYPIRLDKAVLTCAASWAQDIRETRHIGDFEQWKDHDHYQEGFKRLLRALTTKQPTKET